MTAAGQERPTGSRCELEFVGTATTLLRLGPFTVLTDPNFLHRGQRAYLGHGLFSRRLTEPSLQPADLPDLDAVVLSHLHGDHFDRVARRGLDRTLPILTTEPAARRLRRWGFPFARGLPTWQSHELARGEHRLRVTAVPGQHAPGPATLLLPTVMGSLLELHSPGEPDVRVYVTGDTLLRPWLAQVGRHAGPLDAVVLHLGGTRVLGLLVTMDGRQGAGLLELLQPPVAVPVHVDDYTVFRSPLGDFLDAVADRDLRTEVRTVARGASVSLLPS